MTILVTGATGRVGRHLVDQLVRRGATVRVLTRDPARTAFPAEVDVAQGDLLDLDASRAAFAGVCKLFLLNAVTGDEFNPGDHNAQRSARGGCRAGRVPVGV